MLRSLCAWLSERAVFQMQVCVCMTPCPDMPKDPLASTDQIHTASSELHSGIHAATANHGLRVAVMKLVHGSSLLQVFKIS